MKHAFKTIGSVVVMSALMIMAASCAKENLSEETQDNYYAKGELRDVNVSTVMPASSDKAFMDNNRYVQWVEGDLLNINGTKLAAEDVRGPNNDTASFKGSVYALTVSGKDIYWSVYPANKLAAYSNALPSAIATDGKTVNITFPKTYTYSDVQLNQPLSNLNLMVGRSEVAKNAELKKIQMKNLCSILKINMKAATGVFAAQNTKTVQKVIVSSCDGVLAGTYKVNGSGVISAGSSTSNTVTVTFSNPVDISTQKSVYIMLPPTLSSQCLNVTLVSTDDKYYYKASSTATLARNTMYTANMTAVDFSTLGYDNSLNNSSYYFSVASDRTVIFSPGNLQYNAVATVGSGTHFRFAPNQWDYVGMECKYGTVFNEKGQKSKNESIGASYDGWIDLFGWGTSGHGSSGNVRQPYYNNTTNSNYGPGLHNLTGDYAAYDWGRSNSIYNPKTNTTQTNYWRLLTATELEYLINTRSGKTINGKANARYAMAQIRTDKTTVHGLILFPDNYDGQTSSGSGVTFSTINSHSASWATKCTAAGWKNLESHGCVFIPASGWRAGTTVGSVGNNPDAIHPYQVYCWTSTYVDADFAHHLLANKEDVKDAVGPKRSNGYGVRLVRTRQ